MNKTCSDSPALQKISDEYPASWHKRVPKRIKMAKTVTGDLPFPPFLCADKDSVYECWVNSHGAVAVIIGEDMLGVKPYEFEVIEWHKSEREKTSKDKVLEIFPGSVEMPDPSGAPSADYCIVRPATKEDWPENKWVDLGPYVSGNPWDAAWRRICMERDGITEQDIADSTPKWPWES